MERRRQLTFEENGYLSPLMLNQRDHYCERNFPCSYERLGFVSLEGEEEIFIGRNEVVTMLLMGIQLKLSLRSWSSKRKWAEGESLILEHPKQATVVTVLMKKASSMQATSCQNQKISQRIYSEKLPCNWWSKFGCIEQYPSRSTTTLWPLFKWWLDMWRSWIDVLEVLVHGYRLQTSEAVLKRS